MEQMTAAAPSDREAKALARREKVAQAARVLFAEHGFHNTGIAQISKLSGVLVGQIYRDFENKEAIVAAIVERDMGEFLGDGDLCTACDDAAVRHWIARFVACSEVGDSRLVAEIMAESARNERVAAIFDAIDTRLREQIVRGLDFLVAPGTEPARVQCVAELVMTLSAGVFQRRLTGETLSDDVLAALIGCVNREIDSLK